MTSKARIAIIGSVVAVTLAAAFGIFSGRDVASAEPSANDPLYKAVKAKAAACGLEESATKDCNENAAEEVKCGCHCLADATCDQVHSGEQNNPFLQCLATCRPKSE